MAGLSAFFAGVTAILAKCGIRKTDSDVATAIRTVVVLIFSWIMVAVVGSFGSITSIAPRSFVFLILSGAATGASWICYFKALSLGDVNKVVPVDKSSVILTVLFAVIVLGETNNLAAKLIGTVLIATGTFLMIEKKAESGVATTAKQNPTLADIRGAVGDFRGSDVHTRKDRHRRRRIESRNGRAHLRRSDHGVGDRSFQRQGGSGEDYRPKRASVYHSFGYSYRRVLALLLLRDPKRRGQRRSSHR